VVFDGKVTPAAKQRFDAGHETPKKYDGGRRRVETCHLPPLQVSAKAWKNLPRVLSSVLPTATQRVADGHEIPWKFVKRWLRTAGVASSFHRPLCQRSAKGR
jgi:hypothetical protein